jgi:hypothetical protein
MLQTLFSQIDEKVFGSSFTGNSREQTVSEKPRHENEAVASIESRQTISLYQSGSCVLRLVRGAGA